MTAKTIRREVFRRLNQNKNGIYPKDLLNLVMSYLGAPEEKTSEVIRNMIDFSRIKLGQDWKLRRVFPEQCKQYGHRWSKWEHFERYCKRCGEEESD
jgi:hypothetical protein